MRNILLVSVYVVVAFLTFGHVFNANYVAPVDCGAKPEITVDSAAWSEWWDCRIGNGRRLGTLDAAVPALMAGAAWPLYWAGVAGIEVTK